MLLNSKILQIEENLLWPYGAKEVNTSCVQFTEAYKSIN